MTMKINVNPNRMELLRLKKRMGLVKRGHKLLKDKQEELMRQFLTLVKEIRTLRDEVENQLKEGYQTFLSARLDTSAPIMEEALFSVKNPVRLNVRRVPVMNLRVPQFELLWQNGKYTQPGLNTPGDLDNSLKIFSDLLPRLIEMAQKEKAMLLLSDELQRTRRRVNALEYILMPSLEETIRGIEDKLNEMERSNLTRLMKVKEIVRSH
jgi:V/A-type H+-transporting ATPase subunit D